MVDFKFRNEAKGKHMSYIDNNLLPDENVVYRSHLHWVIFLQPLAWFVVTLLLLLYLNIKSDYLQYLMQAYKLNFLMMFKLLLLIPLLIGVFTAISVFIDYISTEFGVTSKRVIMKLGFIRRYTYENFLQKVENIQVNQSVLGRILGYGNIIVYGTGGTREPFYCIDDPLTFRQQIQAQVSEVLEKD
jgi:uncharacterized membrane protein YdbT with pleckstrin-like domain